jgi:Spy/CpxP family protein refolding chaperone
MNKLAWKQILITFAISFVVGVAFGRWEFASQMHHRWKDPEHRQRFILKKLDSKLNLNPDQEKQVAAIFKDFAPKMEAARSEMKPKMEVLRQEVREKIMPILTPDQQKKYDQMEQEWQQRRHKFN